MHKNENPKSKAEELFNERIVIENGVIVLKIYRIEADKDRPCGYHYSLAYIPFWIEDKKLKQNYFRYDNAHGGAHKHRKGKRLAYNFQTPKRLLQDFLEELIEILKEDGQPFEEILELLEAIGEVEI